MLTRHAVVVGLVYLLIWEGLLGGLLDGDPLAEHHPLVGGDRRPRSPTSPSSTTCRLTYALIATAVVIVGATWLTGRRLRAFNLTGDE